MCNKSLRQINTYRAWKKTEVFLQMKMTSVIRTEKKKKKKMCGKRMKEFVAVCILFLIKTSFTNY